MVRQMTEWQVATRDRERAKQLAEATGMHPVAIDVLLQRGLQDLTAIRRFLNPDLSQLHDPLLLPDMPQAVERISRAVKLQEQICIYGDYDADGLTATALLVRFFRDLGLSPSYYIPHRLEEGYGLNSQAIREIAGDGARLLITVDCGINSQAEVALASELGLDVIITDHHTPDESRRPCAHAVINPKLPGNVYPFIDLAGVGVAAKLVQALGGLAAVARYLELVAIGTIADVVPLLDENRVLVQQGLLALQQPAMPGIVALLAQAGVEPGQAKAGSVSYQLAPRLNAAGRLNQADRALELLLTSDLAQASELALLLDRYNQERQAIEQQILQEAEQMLSLLQPEERWCIVLANSGWHHGVVGIVASRLAERYHRPVIMLAVEGEESRGSGRSIPGYNLVAALQSASHLLSTYGGHQAAAGLTLATAQIEGLRQMLNQHVQENLSSDLFAPRLRLDGELDPSELTLQLVRSLEELGPFGHAHPEPVFCSRRWRLENAKLVGREGQHLKLRLDGGGLPWEVMAFRRGEDLQSIAAEQWLDVAYSVQQNSWNGRTNVVLYLRDWHQAAELSAVSVYDRRQELERGLSLRDLFEQPQAVITVFWPAVASVAWTELWRSLSFTLPDDRPGPLFIRAVENGWRLISPEQVSASDQLYWLDAPLGQPSLLQLVRLLQSRLYRLGIHLLYNGNDIDRAYKLLETHGPNRQAMAALFLALRSAEQTEWQWSELAQVLQSSGLLLLKDQVQLHLQVMQELSLAECACSTSGACIRLLPATGGKQDLMQSQAFSEAAEQLAAFEQAREWLKGPDAAGRISRELTALARQLGHDSL